MGEIDEPVESGVVVDSRTDVARRRQRVGAADSHVLFCTSFTPSTYAVAMSSAYSLTHRSVDARRKA